MLRRFQAFGKTIGFSMVFQKWPLAGEAGFGRLGGLAGPPGGCKRIWFRVGGAAGLGSGGLGV